MQKQICPLFLKSALFLIFLKLPTSLQAQSGCPGCSTSLPPLPADTIYISAAPDGIAGAYYDHDISFRMPKTTTPVSAADPGTPPGLNINSITILSVVNVPPGLNWQPNQFEFDPAQETDGCVKFCGTPLQPGLYEVQVFVSAQVLVATQSTSFSFPIYIAPAVSNNAGFSMQNASGCGAVTVSFENNIPSNDQPGYSYHWDFGNGNTSQEEVPAPQTYSDPGVYPVSYQATIDTFGFMLTTVRVLSVGCTDFGLPTSVPPDLYVKIKDPAGNLILSTNPADNVSLPYSINANLLLQEGTYELEVRDEDLFGSESCGYVYFDKYNTDTLVSGDLRVVTNILHPVSVISSHDTVVVFPNPAPPMVSPGPLLQICQGSSVTLQVGNFSDHLQWYLDTLALFGEIAPSLTVTEPGYYYATYTSDDGCISQSTPVTVDQLPLPAPPAFHAEGNELVLNDSTQLPGNYSLQWFHNGSLVTGATGLSHCNTIPGTSLYTLQVTDGTTGCTRTFSLGVTLDPGQNCSTAYNGVYASDEWLVFPNPTDGLINIRLPEETRGMQLLVQLLSAAGQVVLQQMLVGEGSQVDMRRLPAGVYFMQVQFEHGLSTFKVVKR